MATRTAIPHDITLRLERVREASRQIAQQLDAHARDQIMQAGSPKEAGAGAGMEALARAQLVRSHVTAALASLEHALREAGHNG